MPPHLSGWGVRTRVASQLWSPPPCRYEGELDIFGPLFRFLLRPRPAVQAEVDAFSRRHFFRPPESNMGPAAGMPLLVGVHVRLHETLRPRDSQLGLGAAAEAH